MSQVILSLLSGFIGAIIGAAGSVAVVLIQARKEDRRHRREMATRIALDGQASHITNVKGGGGGAIYPIELYLAHANAILKAIDKVQ